MHVDTPAQTVQQQERAPAAGRPPRGDDRAAAPSSPDLSLATTASDGAAEIVALRQRHDRTHLIVAAGESRYHVTVAVARDHSTGRAIGFRHWIRSERVTLGEQESINAALRDIALLERGLNSRQDPTIPADSRTIDAAPIHSEVVEDRRQPVTQW